MSKLLEDLKESISKTQHTIIKLSMEDYKKVEHGLFTYIWDNVYMTNHICYKTYRFESRWLGYFEYTTRARIVVCKEDEIEGIVKQCIEPTTFFIIEEITMVVRKLQW
jgi:hypothetical protein